MMFTRNPGRRIGLIYLLVLVPGVFALMYVPGKLFIRDNPAATLGNIAASEALFRLGIGAELFSQALFIVVVLSLHELLKGINARRSVLMATLAIAPIPIAFLNELNAIATLILVHGEGFASWIDKPQRDALAMLFLKLHGFGLDIAAVFWGLWLLPLGLLVYESRFIPRILGILLIANCVSYVANSFASLVLPQYEDIISRWMTPFGFGELLFLLWLLVMGAVPGSTRDNGTAPVRPA